MPDRVVYLTLPGGAENIRSLLGYSYENLQCARLQLGMAGALAEGSRREADLMRLAVLLDDVIAAADRVYAGGELPAIARPFGPDGLPDEL